MSGATMSVWITMREYSSYQEGSRVSGESIRNDDRNINIQVPLENVKNIIQYSESSSIYIQRTEEEEGE
jgi:hypothetical protein